MGAETILVVEDDREIRDVICSVLSDAGFAVECVAGVGDALGFLRKTAPVCMVIDLQLADGSADEILETWRGRALPPTILVSASPSAGSIAKRYGVAHLRKPFDLEVLLAAVEVAIANKISPRELR